LPYRDTAEQSRRETEALAAFARADLSYQSLRQLRVRLTHVVALASVLVWGTERFAAALSPAIARIGAALWGAAAVVTAGAIACELFVGRDRRRCARRLSPQVRERVQS
jgi:hypothetical protein